MTNPENIPEVITLWGEHSNCAQSTGKGLLDHFNHEEAGNVLLSSFIPYGGGFMSGNVCGAVSGTLAAMSYILSKKNSSIKEIFQLTSQMKEKFANEFGSINCIEIISPFLDLKNVDMENLNMESLMMANPDILESEVYKTCTSCVNKAAIIAKELIEKSA